MKKRILALVLTLIMLTGASAMASVIEDLGYTPEVDSITVQVTNVVLQENNKVELWIEENFGIDINYVYLSGNALAEKIPLWIASGEKMPDMLTLDNYADYKMLLEQDLLLPIEDVLLEYGQNIYASRERIYGPEEGKAWVERFREKDGHIYMIDNSTVISDHQNVIIRTDWLRNLGMDMPTTPDELYDVLYAFVYNDPDQNGIDDTYGFFYQSGSLNLNFKSILPAFNYNAEQWVWKDGEVVLGPSCIKEGAAALEFLHKLYKDGLIQKNYLTATADDRWAQSRQGKIGMAGFLSLAYIKPGHSDWARNGEEWASLINIVGPEGHSGVLSYRHPALPSQCGLVMPKGCVDQKLCVMLTNMLCTRENLLYVFNGEENVHFVYDDYGVVQYIEPYTEFNSRTAEGHAYTYCINCIWDTLADYSYPTFISDAIIEKMKQHQYTPIPETPSEISEESLDAGMWAYIQQIQHDLIMNGGDFEAVLTEMVETLYSDYNLARQEEICRAYAEEKGYLPPQ